MTIRWKRHISLTLVLALMIIGAVLLGTRWLDSTDGTEGARTNDSPTNGLSLNEARERAVLHADYDLLACPTQSQEVTSSFEIGLKNVGARNDSYLIAVDGSQGATAEPSVEEIDLAAGEGGAISVKLVTGTASNVDIVILSRGLGGVEVVRLPLDWRC